MKVVKCVAHFWSENMMELEMDFKEIKYGGVHRHLAHCGHLATSWKRNTGSVQYGTKFSEVGNNFHLKLWNTEKNAQPTKSTDQQTDRHKSKGALVCSHAPATDPFLNQLNSIPSHPAWVRKIVILSSHLHPCLLRGLFHSGHLTKPFTFKST